MLSALAKRRLTKLIVFMEKLPRKAAAHFDMTSWCDHKGDDHEHDGKKVLTRKDLFNCGMTACAGGWAATMPYFQRLGLRLEPHELRIKGYLALGGGMLSETFAISYDQACELFGSDQEDKSPKQWAKRARKLLKEWDTAPHR